MLICISTALVADAELGLALRIPFFTLIFPCMVQPNSKQTLAMGYCSRFSCTRLLEHEEVQVRGEGLGRGPYVVCMRVMLSPFKRILPVRYKYWQEYMVYTFSCILMICKISRLFHLLVWQYLKISDLLTCCCFKESEGMHQSVQLSHRKE